MICDRVLLASALVHALDGAHLTTTDGHGRSLMVGRHPSADIDPCRWRMTLVEASRRGTEGTFSDLALVDVAGSIDRAPSGGFVQRSEPTRQWFAVKLPPCVVVDVLRTIHLGSIPEDAVSATVRPDPDLGVTVIGVGVDAPCMLDALDDLAADVGSALAVAELCASLPVAET